MVSTKFFFSWSNNGSKRICRKTYLQHQKNRRAVSIIATYMHLKLKKSLYVGKNNFSPPPKVDSVILKIIKKNYYRQKINFKPSIKFFLIGGKL